MLKKILSIVISAAIAFSAALFLPADKSIVQPETAVAASTNFTRSEAVNWAIARANEGWEVDVDGVNGCQCVDLIKAYFKLLEGYMPVANACEYMTISLPSTWSRIYSGSPQPGDVVVWDRNAALGAGATWNADSNYGHIGIVVENLGSTFRTVETNSYPRRYGINGGPAGYNERGAYSCLLRPSFKSDKPAGEVMSSGAGQTIPDGDYWIYSKLDSNYFVDIPGEKVVTGNGTNVQMWKRDTLKTYDLWTVKYLNNGFYKIKQKGGSLCLDSDGNSVYAANVHMWEDNGSNAQQWSIKPNYGGYTLQAKCSSFYLDVSGAQIASETNVQTWTGNDSNAQRFCFIPYKPDNQPVADGKYRLRSACNANYYLDAEGDFEYKNSTNIQIWKAGPDWFEIIYQGDGWYRIKEPTSGLYVEAVNKGDATYCDWTTNVMLYGKTNSRGQLWCITKTSDGYYQLCNQLNGLYLDLEDGKCVDGHNVSLHSYNTGNAEKWKFIPVELKSISVTPPTKKEYTIGDSIDITGMTVTALYTDGTTKDVTYGSNLTYDNKKAGNVTVTVEYGGKKTSFQVTYIGIPGDFKGSGTKDDPYLIYTNTDLKNMRDLINNSVCNEEYGGKYYKLMDDIDLGNKRWTPIGIPLYSFSGHFDGNNHTIRGLLVVEREDKNAGFAGLFGFVSGNVIIENLAVEGTVESRNPDSHANYVSVGGIAGGVSGSNAIIRDCCFIGDVKGNCNVVGGIVGYILQWGVIENCYHNGTVSGKDYVGGIIGRINSYESNELMCKLENCYHTGTISYSSDKYGTVFGSLGEKTYPSAANIINCYGLTTDGQLYGGVKADVMEINDKTSDEMKKLGADLLGDAFVTNPYANFNGGYPIFPWQAAIKGDVNLSGSVSVADLVMLEKYLLGSIKTLSSVDNADLCEDGKIDAYDIVLLRQLLVEK